MRMQSEKQKVFIHFFSEDHKREERIDLKTHPEQPHLSSTDSILGGEKLGAKTEHTRRGVLSMSC